MSKWFILNKSFGIRPVDCLSWQPQQSYNRILWANCNQQSHVHYECLFFIFFCHWQADVVILSVWQHHRNDSYGDRPCLLNNHIHFVTRKHKYSFKKSDSEVSCYGCSRMKIVKISEKVSPDSGNKFCLTVHSRWSPDSSLKLLPLSSFCHTSPLFLDFCFWLQNVTF